MSSVNKDAGKEGKYLPDWFDTSLSVRENVILRDRFAMAALAGEVAAGRGRLETTPGWCYQMADGMMVARVKR